MVKYRRSEQRKAELVGKRFGYLVVEDIENRKAKCVCDCGNKKEVSIYHLLDGHTISCGCYRKSDIKAKKYSEWCKNNKDILIEKGKRHSQWFTDNPEKKEIWKRNLKESCNKENYRINISQRRKSYFVEHPEDRLKCSIRMKDYFNTNQDKLRDFHNSLRKWIKNNPEKIVEKSKKYSDWCKKNPDKIIEKSRKHSEWIKKNKEVIGNLAENHKSFYQQYRKESITDVGRQILKDILQKSDYDMFCSGSLKSNYIVKIKCSECGKEISCRLGNLFILARNELKRELPRCSSCRTSSSYEREIESFISSFYTGICIRNSRDIVPPYEIDLYYPDKKIGIEVNGWFWHSTEFKNTKFHYLKWNYCKERGIRLLSIFEQDLIVNKEKLFEFLRNTFSSYQGISARKCVLKKVDYKELIDFLTFYYMGTLPEYSDICYGLYYNNILVSCIGFTFISNDSYKLDIFASKYEHKVHGGFSRLFKKFLEEYKPNSVIAYSDNDYFLGSLYSKLGFLNHNQISNYQWVKYKSVISKEKSKTILPQNNKEILEGDFMKELGYYQVYRCGHTHWVWSK